MYSTGVMAMLGHLVYSGQVMNAGGAARTVHTGWLHRVWSWLFGR
jgi:hypothetical protein